ncbi:peptidoglycan glycosyltransferase [Catenuloplanes nepalensis]|uniref:Peptidoglycan glycosyltransferase n=1 Tax=Catenuloplanes nepalensis TaxID=587533 RepID=A0ABT9N436_9ACTN|nr:penicillin-binding protein 2 [Catenuloplanes nepalensis]MDP9798442.1 peptidoglycan glycosyltransferase [Catenuloplanes nepalensis]
MNAPLRKAGIVIMVLFGMLFANLNWVQAVKGEEYRTNAYNTTRTQIAEYGQQRGNVEVNSGTATEAVALSKLTDDALSYQREYPFGDLYAHVTGYKPVYMGSTSVERFENDYLSGQSDELFTDRVRALFTGEESAGGNILLTVNKKAQETAYKQLKENELGVTVGAAVAIDPSTGGIQAMVSMPSFDPTPLVGHDADAAAAAYAKYEADKGKPLLNRAVAEVWPPGSVFKIIDSAAALEAGMTPETSVQAGPAYTAPGTTHEITNAGPGVCPESEITLIRSLTVSCNTSFSRLAVEKLGADALKKKAADFGFEDTALTCGNLKNNTGLTVATSTTGEIANPDGSEDKAGLAQSAIGQKDVRMTPLQGAMIAAAVANDGVQMRPYIVDRLLGPDRTSTHYTASPQELRRSVDSDVARDLQTMMESVVNNGTATSAQVEGYDVGGKTGTSQNGVTDNHGWFVGYAMKDGKPVSAVAVFLEAAGDGGSAEATRIAGQILKAVTSERGGN